MRFGRRISDREEESGELSMLRRLDVLLGERRRTVVALAVTALISGFAEAGTLALIAEVGATFVGGKKHAHIHTGGFDLSLSIGVLLVIALILAVIRLLMQIPLSVLPARIASEVQASLRTKLFHAYTGASWEVQSRDREGQLQDTMTSQTMQATGGAVGATGLIINGLNLFALLVTAFLLNIIAAAGILVAGVLLFIAVRPLKKLGVRRARALSLAQVSYASGINEAIRLAEETHVFGVASAQRRRIDALVDESKRLFYSTQLLGKLVPSIFQSLILIMLAIALIIIHAVGISHPDALGAIILLLVRSARSGQQGLATYQSLSQTLPFIERTQDAEQRYVESAPPEGDVPLQVVQTIAFRDVSYAYRPDRPVLSDVSFEVTRGEVIGIIGPTGAGKSTMIQILLQLRSAKGGEYLVNGVPAEQFVRADWHGRVVYVPQEPRLLHATVFENIRFDRDIDLPAVERAAKLAHIHDEIMTWADGYDTLVGPRADAVSGGQQQRLCLARALAATPEVLVLDEPTSALDPKSEALIQESLNTLKHDLTLFIIAHRMSTLDICDRVMVIMGGRLVAFDTIDALRENNAYYRSASAIATGSRT
ncbi:MAG TPA: ABC transporter ATP-binding protein [Solirubrobacteraceae bacterium]|nr:ABC transporter ATP-binding protein [Solirubrobacteraceae bacterium]